jgi:hypothetical protein
VAVLLPDSIGEAILGDSWAGARSVLLPVALLNLILALSLAALTALRAAKAAKTSFRVRAFTSGMIVVFGCAGAVLDAASGAAWGIVLGSALGLIAISQRAWAITGTS